MKTITRAVRVQRGRRRNITILVVGACQVTRSCLTLCDPMDGSLPGSFVHGISQAGILEWVTISFSKGVFPTQGINPGLLHWQADSFSSEPLGKPNLYERSSFLSYHRDGRIKAQKIGISQFIIHRKESQR